MRICCTVYKLLWPSSHEIWACTDNKVTLLIHSAKFFWPIGDHINGVPQYVENDINSTT